MTAPAKFYIGTREYVRVRVNVSDGTDPTGNVVEIAIVPVDTAPAGWSVAIWQAGGPPYYAQVLVSGTGGGGAIELAAGLYDVWVRVTDVPEIPVLRSGQLEVTEADDGAETAPTTLVCSPWITGADLCAPCADPGAYDDNTLETAIAMSSDVLFVLSGSRWPGECSRTVRPCGRALDDKSRPRGWHRSWGACSCNRSRRCGCGSISEIALGGYPINEVSEVKVDGVVLDPSEYRVDDSRWLVRLPDAEGRSQGWPCCQRLDRGTDEDETFSVTYSYGHAPPAAGVRAASALACQLLISCSAKPDGCTLPKRVTSITRQGITAVVLDPFDFLDEGKTGVYEVDLFLKAVNPSGQRRRARVLSPDLGARARRTG